MSWKATAYVKELCTAPNGQEITRSEKLVMFILADCYHPDYNRAWPSITRLATASLMSTRNVRRVLRSLQSKGAVEITESRGLGHTNSYRFPGFSPDVTTSKSGTVSGLPHGKTGQAELGNRTSHVAKSDTALSGKPNETKTGTAEPSQRFFESELASLKLKNSVGNFSRRVWRERLGDPAEAASLPVWFRLEAEKWVRE